MGSWLVPISEMTEEQTRAVELAPTEHRLIVGAPGSGKTLVLVYRACHLIRHFRCKPDRFRVFVFTKALREFIRAGARDAGLPIECIITFDSWCMEFHKANISGSLPRDSEKNTDFEAVRFGVLRYLKSLRGSARMYDFVMVDEGQDLDQGAFSILTIIAHHVSVCMDHKQQIYERGADEKTILDQLGLRKRNMALLEAHRCCPYISQLASHYIADGSERQAFLRQTRAEQIERETPVLFIARHTEEERSRLFEMVRLRQGNGERVAILLPQKRQAFGFAQGLAKEGMEVENPDQLDFRTDTPKIMSYHSAKGLTFDTVVMPRLLRDSFRWNTPEHVRRLLFVGITRATRWVYMSTIANKELDALKSIMDGDTYGCLTIQRDNEMKLTGTDSTSCESFDETDELLGLL